MAHIRMIRVEFPHLLLSVVIITLALSAILTENRDRSN